VILTFGSRLLRTSVGLAIPREYDITRAGKKPGDKRHGIERDRGKMSAGRQEHFKESYVCLGRAFLAWRIKEK
jgi:hypothetical protein